MHLFSLILFVNEKQIVTFFFILGICTIIMFSPMSHLTRYYYLVLAL